MSAYFIIVAAVAVALVGFKPGEKSDEEKEPTKH